MNTTYHIKNILNAVNDNSPLKVKENTEKALYQKVGEYLSNKKIELASSVLKKK